jgi:hypothetical protein
MMVKTGILNIDNNTDISELDSGTSRKRLARDGDGDPFGLATDFLTNERGLSDQQFIWVAGSEKPVGSGGATAIFITDAGPGSQAVNFLTAASEALGLGALDAASKQRGKSAERSGGKKSRGGKKGGTKKGGAKKR